MLANNEMGLVVDENGISSRSRLKEWLNNDTHPLGQ
jgi:hypothetical protein